MIKQARPSPLTFWYLSPPPCCRCHRLYRAYGGRPRLFDARQHHQFATAHRSTRLQRLPASGSVRLRRQNRGRSRIQKKSQCLHLH